jgi:hypothetical protein
VDTLDQHEYVSTRLTSTLKMDVACTSETSTFLTTIRCKDPEAYLITMYECESLIQSLWKPISGSGETLR